MLTRRHNGPGRAALPRVDAALEEPLRRRLHARDEAARRRPHPDERHPGPTARAARVRRAALPRSATARILRRPAMLQRAATSRHVPRPVLHATRERYEIHAVTRNGFCVL